MHTLIALLALVTTVAASPPGSAGPKSPAPGVPVFGAVAPINAVVGDVSWVERYGRTPTAHDARTRDEERHALHLAWIERKLRARDVAHLDETQRANRGWMLHALHAYAERGVHPENELSVRAPRFLDEDGRICAVGYLIEVSESRALVEAINHEWEHDYLLEMDAPVIEAWAARMGFSMRELASIQPTGVSVDGSAIALVALGGLAGGSAVIGADITLAVLAAHFGDRGVPTGVAVFELIWGAAHLTAIAGLVPTIQDESLGALGFGALTLIGAIQIGHAIWSLAATSGGAPPPEAPRVSVSAAPLEGGAQLALAGTF